MTMDSLGLTVDRIAGIRPTTATFQPKFESSSEFDTTMDRALIAMCPALTVRFTRHMTGKDTPENLFVWADSTFGPLTWAFSGGEGTRTLGLYIAKVWLSVFLPGPFRGLSW